MNNGAFKVLPMIFGSIFLIFPIIAIVFPEHIVDDTTGEPLPFDIAIVMFVLGAVFVFIAKYLSKRFVNIEFYESGIKCESLSMEIIKWEQVESIKMVPFTQPPIHTIKVKDDSVKRLFCINQSFISINGFTITKSNVIRYWKDKRDQVV